MPRTLPEGTLTGLATLLFAVLLAALYLMHHRWSDAHRKRGASHPRQPSRDVYIRLLEINPTLVAALDNMYRYTAMNRHLKGQ